MWPRGGDPWPCGGGGSGGGPACGGRGFHTSFASSVTPDLRNVPDETNNHQTREIRYSLVLFFFRLNFMYQQITKILFLIRVSFLRLKLQYGTPCFISATEAFNGGTCQ